MGLQGGRAHFGLGRWPAPLRKLRGSGLSGYFLPILYTKMNMNRNRRKPMKTNDPCTVYSKTNRVLFRHRSRRRNR